MKTDYLQFSVFPLILRSAALLGLLVIGGWYVIGMPGKSWSGAMPPLAVAERQIHDNLKRHVEELAGRIGERNVWRPQALVAAADYIRDTLVALGYEVSAQPF